MREPRHHDHEEREARRHGGGWQGGERDERRRDDPGPGRQTGERWGAEQRSLSHQEWSRPATGEGSHSTDRRADAEHEWRRFNEFEDYGFSGGGESPAARDGRENLPGSGGWRGSSGAGERWRGGDLPTAGFGEREANQADRERHHPGRVERQSYTGPWPGPRDFLDAIPRGDYGRVGFAGQADTRGIYGRGEIAQADPSRYGRGMQGVGDVRPSFPGDEHQGSWQPTEPGPYVGRGPRNYRRSDERLSEEICDRLMQHPHIDASDIEVEVKDGEVTLRGRVHDRRVKHAVEDLVDGILGVQDIHNQLRVERGFFSRVFGGGDEHQPGEHERHADEGRHQGSTVAGGSPGPGGESSGATLTGTDATASDAGASATAHRDATSPSIPGTTPGAGPTAARPTGRGSRKEQ
jgi:osmotically-inducible protein OsmY